MSYFRFSVGFVGKSGLEPLNSEEDRFTVCCNCHYATSPYCPTQLSRVVRADEGTRTPDRLITNQLLYQLSYIGFFQRFKQLSFLVLRLQKYNFFQNLKIFFQLFFIVFYYSIVYQYRLYHFFCYYYFSQCSKSIQKVS